MLANSDSLREHYISLSDEALLEVDPAELTPAAAKQYDEELQRRSLSSQREIGGGSEDEPEWLEDAACASTFIPVPGNDAAGDAGNARAALRNAGIPCYLDAHQNEDQSFEYRVLVPGKLSLPAMSVLDAEIFNATVEDEWKQYFETLSDEELRDVDTQLLFRGLLDRVKRVTQAYADELAYRNGAPDTPQT